MATNDSLQRYIDAGIAFTNMTRKKAEELVSELVKSGDLQTDDAKARVDELLERGRQGTEVIVSAVRSEVHRQLGTVGITNLEDLANQVATLLGRSGTAGTPARKAVAKKAPAKKAAAKKAPAKKAAVKKAPAKKTTAKKAPAKKAAAKRAAPAAPPAQGSAD
jgi:polyhydroxyalkanoate synthesis regulator phasin